MLPSIRHSAGTERVAAEIVAASSNHSEGRAAPAALTVTASSATPTASHGRTGGVGGSAAVTLRRSSTEMLTLCA